MNILNNLETKCLEDSDGYPNYIENSTDHLYIFLQQFYTMFPEQQPNSFYAFGESYGGKYAPQLALKIHEENLNLNGNIKINLGIVKSLESYLKFKLSFSFMLHVF